MGSSILGLVEQGLAVQNDLLIRFTCVFVIHVFEALEVLGKLAGCAMPYPESFLDDLHFFLFPVSLGRLWVDLFHVLTQLLLLTILFTFLELVVQLRFDL